MKFILLIHHTETNDEKELKPLLVESIQLANDLHRKGQYSGRSAAENEAQTVSVKVRNGKRIVTDGPFAETRAAWRLFSDRGCESR